MTLSMVVEHLSMVVFAIVIAILIGVPLGLMCYLSRAARGVVLRVVDLIQTTPALALLGIIMVTPLGAGKPTVILGLALYSLLPIVRNVTLGLSQVSPAVDGGKIGGGLHGHGGTGGRYQHTVGHAPDKPAFGVHADKGRQRDDQNGNDDFEHLLSPLRNAETDHAASPSGKPPVSKRHIGPRRCGIATHAPKASGEGVAGHTGASLSAVRKGSSLCCLTTSRPVPRGTRRDGGRRNPHR